MFGRISNIKVVLLLKLLKLGAFRFHHVLPITPLYGADAPRSKLKMKASDFCVSSQVVPTSAKNSMRSPRPSLLEGHAPQEAQGRPTVHSQELKHRMNGQVSVTNQHLFTRKW